ncbi:MAG: hypothetical protein ABIJ42_09920, partial [Acidobacteriota bacterium]
AIMAGVAAARVFKKSLLSISSSNLLNYFSLLIIQWAASGFSRKAYPKADTTQICPLPFTYPLIYLLE